MNESVERIGWHVVPEKQEATVIIPRDIKFIVPWEDRVFRTPELNDFLSRFVFIMSGFWLMILLFVSLYAVITLFDLVNSKNMSSVL